MALPHVKHACARHGPYNQLVSVRNECVIFLYPMCDRACVPVYIYAYICVIVYMYVHMFLYNYIYVYRILTSNGRTKKHFVLHGTCHLH